MDSTQIEIGNADYSVALKPAEVSELVDRSDPVVTAADALEIVDQNTLDMAGIFLTEKIKPTLKLIAESCKPVVQAANAAHKAATKQRNDLEAPLKRAETVVKSKIGAYLAEQDRIRREEQERIDAERRRQEEEEQLRQAEALEAEGKTEEADAVLEGPAPEIKAPMPAPPPPPRKAPGVSTRKIWKAEVTDLTALIKAVAAGHVPESIVDINVGALERRIRAEDGQVGYPGVRVYQESVVSARSR